MLSKQKLFAFILTATFAVAQIGEVSAYDEIARAEEREALFTALKAAPNQKVADAAVSAIWEHWQTAPDDKAQNLLNSARQRMRIYDYAGAIELLDELVDYVPEYSEGWNTRATTLFLQQKYDRSLEDVEKTLSLEPAHFGALAGRAIILMRQGRAALSQEALRRAVDINPFLRERSMLIDTPE